MGNRAAKPAWAEAPLDMNGAAEALGVCRRTLTDILSRFPLFESRGRKKVFYREHIEGLREALRCEKIGSRSGEKAGAGKLTSRSKVTDFAAALASVTAAKRTSRETPQSGSTGQSGSVTSIR